MAGQVIIVVSRSVIKKNRGMMCFDKKIMAET